VDEGRLGHAEGQDIAGVGPHPGGPNYGISSERG